MSQTLLLEVAAGLGVIGLCSVPGILALLHQLQHRNAKDNFYEDKDGKSTPEAIAAFSNRWPKLAVATFTALGFGSSLAASILVTTQDIDKRVLFLENWLLTASWLLLGLQAICITAMHSPVEAYNLGLWAWFSSLILGLVMLLQDTAILDHLLKHHVPSFILRIVNLAAVLGLFGASVALPRRPDVYHNGRLVDRMYTVSAFTRFNWSWATDLMALATKHRTFEAVDLGRPDHFTRAADTSATWNAKFKGVKLKSHWALWGRIIWFFRWSLTLQWIVATSRNFLSIAPFWVTLQILQALERRKPGESLSVNTWLMVFWLGFTIAADAWVTASLFWLSWCEVLVPLRGLLSALVVEKAMRRKNVKSTTNQSPLDAAAASDKKDDKAEEDDDEADALKSQQGIVNLIGVDAKRVSDFAAFQFFIPSSAARLAVAMWFLVTLLGWIPVLGGLATWGVILPLNIYYTKLYASAQDRLMKIRDQKLAIVNESLQGMRQIKFSALETQWGKRILGMREKELEATWDVFRCDTLLFGSWIVTPVALAAASLSIYAVIHRELTPSVAFVSIGVFKALELALSLVPELITDMIDADVSVRRMFEYFNAPEVEDNILNGPDVAFEDAQVAWPAEEETLEADRFVLRNVNLSFPTGELSIISGPTGSGKSLLLASILGETDLLSGKIYAPKPPSIEDRRDHAANKFDWIIPGSIAFISQIPWIENATLKDNILFGLPLDEERFQEVVQACALEKDLQMLSDGERTELGANGVNLSGGQKWRVTLARAVYSRAGILIMDDIFSAVDTHVGRHIFEKCLTGPLCRGRTRILVTHHVALVESRAKYIAELGNGTVQHCGLLSELDEDGTLELIKSHEPTQALREPGEDDRTAVNSEQISTIEPQTLDEEDADGGIIKKVPSRAARQFVEEETREQGAIKGRVYGAYLRDSGGWSWWIFALIIFVGFEGIIIARSWWLRIWTADKDQGHVDNFTNYQFAYATDLQHVVNTVMTPTATTDVGIANEKYSLNFYLAVYITISVLTAVIGTFRFGFMFMMSIKASRRLFENMTYSILRTPLRWIDTVPTGRVLNRFTADFNIIDSRMAIDLTTTAANGLGVIGICAAAMFVSPYIIVLALALLTACGQIALRYLEGARPTKRLESTTKSPIFELFGSALSGVTTIRGFDKAKLYVHAMYDKLDDYDMATWHLWLFNRWMGWRMNIVGALFAVVVAVMVLSNSQMDAALAGFTLSFALEFSDNVLWTIRNYASIELDMNAAERVVEYSELPSENQGGEDPPATWPTEGRLEVDNLVVTYASDLAPVLKGISFTVNKNERVGVVGRTGAGKSSLTLALFRFLEAQAGSIHIDGLDIAKIKLQQLRSRLAIIPQDPVLFSGTVRSNLDPFDERTDEELRDSLQRVHLVGSSPSTPGEPSSSAAPNGANGAQPSNTNPFSSLSSPISEGGLNLSQGQRQLLCLARAIVARPKVMVLDEATSAVDMATDTLIQRSIREEFTGSTLIVIAHRLSTIADFDRILVLSEGKVAEFGSPQELWEKGPDGVFRGMCDESGEKEKLRSVIFGEA